MATHNELGKKGELFAVQYLQKKGYRILERNWRYLKAEIDIIALFENTVVIVEVKNKILNLFWIATRIHKTFKNKIIVSGCK